MEKALIAMSGGVDSSVAALLVKNMGYDCVGCTMKLYDNEDAGISKGHTCCSLDDVEDARSVARSLGMPYYVFNFKDGFREAVMSKFANCYLRGETPNPCIDCNRYMKFEKLFSRADILECKYIVTGHYARITECGGEFFLKKAVDPAKDQSYVLYSLTQEQLGRILFPLGSMTKAEARNIAEKNGFVNARKHDSQDICFAPDGDYAAAVRRISGADDTPGDFVLCDGTVVGRHKGIVHYTLGQRRGLGVAAGTPLYVCAIHPSDNTVVLGSEENLMSCEAYVEDINWISGRAPQRPFECCVKIRYRQKEQPAAVVPEEGTGRVLVKFSSPQRAVTPGQSAVFYDGDTVLGGGTICRAAD